MVAALIHNVNPSSDTTGDGGSKESYADGNVLFYNNYVQAAMLAKQRGLISQVAVHRVANAAIQVSCNDSGDLPLDELNDVFHAGSRILAVPIGDEKHQMAHSVSRRR